MKRSRVYVESRPFVSDKLVDQDFKWARVLRSAQGNVLQSTKHQAPSAIAATWCQAQSDDGSTTRWNSTHIPALSQLDLSRPTLRIGKVEEIKRGPARLKWCYEQALSQISLKLLAPTVARKRKNRARTYKPHANAILLQFRIRFGQVMVRVLFLLRCCRVKELV